MVACVARSLPRVERVLYPAPPSVNFKSGSSIQIILCHCIGCVRNIPMGIPDSLRMPYSSVSSIVTSPTVFFVYVIYFKFALHQNQYIYPPPSFCLESTITCRYNSISHHERANNPIPVLPVGSILLLQKSYN